MNEIVFKIEEDVECGGYFAEAYISEKEQIVTHGNTIDELKFMIQDALECHFENPHEIPEKITFV